MQQEYLNMMVVGNEIRRFGEWQGEKAGLLKADFSSQKLHYYTASQHDGCWLRRRFCCAWVIA